MTDVAKVWVWGVGSLVMGLWLTPVIFNGGKALAELSGAQKDFNGLVNKTAAWSGAAELEDFFLICWPLAGLILMIPLVEWLALGNGGAEKGPWGIRLPYGARRSGTGQALEGGRWGPVLGMGGLLVGFGCFVVIGAMIVKIGVMEWGAGPGGWGRDWLVWLGGALVVATVVEFVFRRVMLGIFLRAMGPVAAIGMSAAMFAGMAFVLSGFGGASGYDGETLSAVHLTGILFGGENVLGRLAGVLVPWFAFGCVLGVARWRTASMWLPTGILMGWLVAERMFKDKGGHGADGLLGGKDGVVSAADGAWLFAGVLVLGTCVFIYRRREDGDAVAD